MYTNWLVKRAQLTPEVVGLRFGENEWTFQELYEEAYERAMLMTAAGIQNGERIAYFSRSSEETVFFLYAGLLKGLEMVLLNTRLTEKELHFQLTDAKVSVLLVEEENEEVPLHVVPVRTYSSFYEETPEEFQVCMNREANETVTIMYTSGTTGRPKGVRQTVQNHTSNALGSVLNLKLYEHESWLCTMPLFHISGFSILVRSLIYGITVHLLPKFDAAQCATLITDGNVTRMSVVATTLRQIVDMLEERDEVASPSFHTMLAGGGPIPPSDIRRAQKRRLPILQTYGMTETSSQTATLRTEDALRKVGSSGKPLFFNDIRIEKEKGQTIGEVCIRGPHVTPGYIGHAEHIQAVDEEGWLHTGDLGYIDEEGYLYVVDRRADLIISGGENIYPAEIEHKLLEYQEIVEAGVCGIPHEEWGEVPIAFLVVTDQFSEEAYYKHCASCLARYKVPHKIHYVESLPRNASNKLLRRELKRWASELTTSSSIESLRH